MIRAVIYARYSSDKQREASIEDQIRLCKERAAREGWQIVECYADHGVSGASLVRPGIQALMRDAGAGRFDLVATESLDRISRDQEDIAGVYKRLRFAGVAIETLSEGPISELQIGFKGTMGALYLKDLADKTRRGLRGRVEAGKSGGGNSYGYEVVRSVNADGEPERGERRINEREARIVRSIFQDYAAGKSPKAIAHALNRSGVPAPASSKPSKGGWGPSTINGNYRRGTGVLNNELYVGRLVWNRLSYIKNPDTGRRVSRLNPESEWIITEVPSLRIVDDELWRRVKDRQLSLRKETEFHDRQRPRMLLSYLLKCGSCGGGFSKISAHHYGCSTARNKGTCENRLTIRQEEIEGLVLFALQSRLMDPALCEEFCAEYTRFMNEQRGAKNAALASARSELEMVLREREKLIQAIKDGVHASLVKDDLVRVSARRDELQAMLESTPDEPVLLHPQMARHYREQVAHLTAALTSEENRAEAAEIIRSLVDRITLSPNDEGKLDVDLYGDLAGILTLAGKRKGPLDPSDPDLQQVKLVAGAGFEPAAFRL